MADRDSSEKKDILWRAVTSTVTPLRGRKAHKNVFANEKMRDVVDSENLLDDTPPSGQEHSPPQSRTEGEAKRMEPLRQFPALIDSDVSPGIDKRTTMRLRRGQLQIEGKLDLHGMTQKEAHQALGGFIRGARGAQRRMVLVITGKGGGGQGVLRKAVPRWLNETSLRPLVLAFAQAQPRDGGGGALYVLLRRRRKPPATE